MTIFCDVNMPFGAEAFATLGQVTLFSGRTLTANDLHAANMLMCRSTTHVNATLLDKTPVRFVGSGVIGVDHLDIPWLDTHHIAWCNAPGCNAESVANYVTTALATLVRSHALKLSGASIGIIGAGHVGSRVMRHARALGLRVLVCDPPRQRNPSDTEAQAFLPLERVLEEADIVTCHVPLTRDGDDPTYHMFDARRFSAMKPGAVFINAARGAILDSDALLAAVRTGHLSHTVMDCWEGEPNIRHDVLEAVTIATPHIAGYAYEGRVGGTEHVYAAACAFLGVAPTYRFVYPQPMVEHLVLDCEKQSDEETVFEAIKPIYEILDDDARLRAAPENFDMQRKTYPITRRQFTATRVTLTHARPDVAKALAGLGFIIA